MRQTRCEAGTQSLRSRELIWPEIAGLPANARPTSARRHPLSVRMPEFDLIEEVLAGESLPAVRVDRWKTQDAATQRHWHEIFFVLLLWFLFLFVVCVFLL